jgi:O-acetyl-ADP-ribose deacetylase (regulator of RNase III)
MIIYKSGDVLQALRHNEIDYVIHGCNSLGVMGSGIAKQIKELYPEAYTVYHNSKRTLGSYTESNGIINLVTQKHYMPRNVDHFDYEAFHKGLVNITQSFSDAKLAMPKIGAGLAGGNWERISDIINQVTGDRIIYVFVLH